MRKSVLITGSGGYVGSLTIHELLKIKNNLKSIVAYDINDVKPQVQQRGITYVQGDIRSKNLTEILRKYEIDTVVHLASIVTPGKKSNREFEYSVDVMGTQNILSACIENKSG